MEVYARRTGKPAAEVAPWFVNGDHWFTADEALAAGLVDEILPALAPRPAGASTLAQDATESPTEAETLALDLLRALGPLRVRDREAFGREVGAWFQNSVRNL